MLEDIKLVWQASKFKPPKILEIKSLQSIKDETVETRLLVVEERGSILTLMDKLGNLYYLALSNCRKRDDEIVCLGPLYYAPYANDSERVQFARKELLPLL
jgi:hypothetical protein